MANIDENYFSVSDDSMKKNAIEDILAPGESVLVRLKPNRRIYIIESIFRGLPVVLLWGGIDAFIIIMMIHSGFFEEMGPTVFFVIAFFLIHLFPVWAYVANAVKRVLGFKNVEYAFTNQRIILRSGLVGVDFKYFYYQNLASAKVKVGLLDRLFKVGDIELVASDNTKAILDDISHPYEYSAKIEKLIIDLKADMSFPNDLRPEANHGYNTTYSPDPNDRR